MTGAPTPPTFLAWAREARASASPQQAMRTLLESTVAALFTWPSPWLDQHDDEVVLMSSAAMTIYHITLSPRIHYPPHDHRLPAMIGLYRGTETSFSYRRDGQDLVQTDRHDHAAPSVAALPTDLIHSVVNMGDVRSAAIHVYFGDLTRVERSIWGSDLRGERPFDNRFYFEQAQRL